MMTPEERARAVVLKWYRGPYTIHGDETADVEIADVSAAIRAAVAAERERAAQLCDALANETRWRFSGQEIPIDVIALEDAATAIRALT